MFFIFGIIGFVVAYFAFKAAERRAYAYGYKQGYDQAIKDIKDLPSTT